MFSAPTRHQPHVAKRSTALRALGVLVVLATVWIGAMPAGASAAAPRSAWSFFTPQLATGPAPRLLDVSCPSRSLCVALDAAGNAWSSAAPGNSSGRWQSTPISANIALNDVSCSATGFCAAVGVRSNIATSSQPTGAGAAWTLTDLKLTSEGDSGTKEDELLNISCASAALCVATNFSDDSNLLVSLDPGASAPTWTKRSVGSVRSGALFHAVSCPARALCAGAESEGTIATWKNATGRWKKTYVEAPSARNGSLTPDIEDVSCPTTTFCAAVDNARHAFTSSHPTGSASAWHRVLLGRRQGMSAISCASASLCVGIGSRGRVLASTRPSGSASSWKPVPVAQPVSRVSCAPARLCLFVTRAGGLIAGTRR